MFRIYDGRTEFYQWDVDRQIIVDDPTITEVHFSNIAEDCSLVVSVDEITLYENGQAFKTIRTANVPNVLLQSAWPISVYGIDSKYTKHSDVFKVRERSRPADYVYTETEVLNYNTLLERINTVEENVGEVVEDYLKENPIDVDLTGYATEKYVDDAVASIEIPEVDLSEYAKKSELPSLEGYATEKYVDDAIANIDIPTGTGEECCVHVGPEAPTDASKTLWVDTDAEAPEYALKSDIPSLEGYAKTSDIPNLDGYAKTSDIPTVPTKVSELANDAGYLTEHQSLEGYAKTTDIPSLDGYAKTSDIPDVSGYQTAAQVEAAITAALSEIGVAEEGAY